MTPNIDRKKLNVNLEKSKEQKQAIHKIKLGKVSREGIIKWPRKKGKDGCVAEMTWEKQKTQKMGKIT